MGNESKKPGMKKWQKRTLIGLGSFLALTIVIGLTADPVEEVATSPIETSISAESQPQESGLEPESASETVEGASGSEELESQQEADPQRASSGTASTTPGSQTSTATSWDQLLGLLVIEPEFQGGYDRTLFRHWIDASGNGCNARLEVLIRQSLTPVTVGPRCAISGGSWFSEFDGVRTTDPSTFDIDHLVPLKEAWESGAHSWDEPTRRAFANDLDLKDSLIAVSASSNRSKGDRDPADWLPTRAEYRCQYVASWVRVKVKWQLSVDAAEKAAIRTVASNCDTSALAENPPAPARTQPTTSPSPAATSSPTPTASPSPTPTASPSPSPTAAPASGEACQPGRVNINTASREELQLIRHIGADRADEIIALRSTRKFSSLDGLDAVSGISLGGVRLQQIKDEGIACVG